MRSPGNDRGGGRVNYYNEFDPQTAEWLRELIKAKLIPDGVVDDRSITEVQPADLAGFVQCHFFAGIGGWSEALRLANWPSDRPVWTGSCPCQPFSSAGKQKAQSDDRHLWPAFFGLIRECQPDVIFGEQVEGAIRHGWLDGVQADLEGEGYAVGHCVLGAHSVGAPHIRQRLYWMASGVGQRLADAKGEYRRRFRENGADGIGRGSRDVFVQNRAHCRSDRLANAEMPRHTAQPRQCGEQRSEWQSNALATHCRVDGMGDTSGTGSQGHWGFVSVDDQGERQGSQRHNTEAGFWSDYDLIPCRDGKARRVKSGLTPLAHGVPARVVRLRGYGNAIVPHVAASFVEAFLETEG